MNCFSPRMGRAQPMVILIWPLCRNSFMNRWSESTLQSTEPTEIHHHPLKTGPASCWVPCLVWYLLSSKYVGFGKCLASSSVFISESILGWHGPKSHSTEQLKNGTLGSLPSASASITWAILPNSTEDEQTFTPEPEVSQLSFLALCVALC